MIRILSNTFYFISSIKYVCRDRIRIETLWKQRYIALKEFLQIRKKIRNNIKYGILGKIK